MTATAITTAPATITVATDTAGISKQAEDLVKSVSDVLSFISDSSAVTSTTTSSGAAAAKGGVFTGNYVINGVGNTVTEAVVAPIKEKSPSEYGIIIEKDGSFTYDKDKFAAAMAADPAGTQNALSTIASRVADATKDLTDSLSGTVPQLVKGRNSEVTDLNNQIADWDTRLAPAGTPSKPSSPTWRSSSAASKPSPPGFPASLPG